MKLAAAVVVAASLAALPCRAHACGVPDLGGILADVAKAFDGEDEPIHSPALILGGGTSRDGYGPSVALGYTWGTRQHGGLFPGSSLTRVLVGYRRAGGTDNVSLTYGWYGTTFVSAGFDFGAEAQLTGTRALGPTTRLTVGGGGLAVRLTGGATFGDNSVRATYAAELVVDVLEVSGKI